MEVHSISENSIRIKTKNLTIVTDPEKTIEADVYLYTHPTSTYPDGSEDLLSIEGPGDYETRGVSIRGVATKNGLYYIIHDDGKILLAATSTVPGLDEAEEEYDAVVLKVVDNIDEKIMGTFSGSAVLLYGETSLVSLGNATSQKQPKVNLKKKEEFVGTPILLN